MQISQNSFVYKTAYLFTSSDKRPVGYINGCILFWRFIFYGLVRLAFDLVALPIILVVGTAILLIRWPIGILVGNKLVFHQGTDPSSDWEEIPLNYVWVPNWKSVPIESWPRIFGWRILPIGILGVLVALLILTAVALLNWDLGARSFAGDYSALGTMFGELLFALLIVCGLFASRLRQSVPVRLLFATVKSFKDRTCPVVEIV